MRVAVWDEGQWVELTVERFDKMDLPTGKTFAIFASMEYAAGGAGDAVSVLGERGVIERTACGTPRELQVIDSLTTDEDRIRDGLPIRQSCVIAPPECVVEMDKMNHGGLVAGRPPVPAGEAPPEHPNGEPFNAPPITPPNWGGLNPKDAGGCVSDPVVRYFTMTLEDGTIVLNQSTAKGATVTDAEASVRKTWGMLSGAQPGKAIVECVFQEDGRVGDDQPGTKAGSLPIPLEPSTPPPSDGVSDGHASLFRWHRGSLEDSMATAVPCTSLGELIEILSSAGAFGDITPERVDVQHYVYDERIEWDTFLVTVDGTTVGMTNGEL